MIDGRNELCSGDLEHTKGAKGCPHRRWIDHIKEIVDSNLVAYHVEGMWGGLCLGVNEERELKKKRMIPT